MFRGACLFVVGEEEAVGEDWSDERALLAMRVNVSCWCCGVRVPLGRRW